MIETVKCDTGVTGDYMRLMQDEEYLRECGIREGIQQGIQQSIIELLATHARVSDELSKKIQEQDDIDILKCWLQYAAKVGNVEEFMNKI